MEIKDIETNEGIDQSLLLLAKAKVDKMLIESGRTPSCVRQKLVDMGLSRELSTSIVEEREMELVEEIRESSKKRMFLALLWILGGVFLSLTSIGFVFFGAIIYGIYEMAMGFSDLRSVDDGL